MNASLLTWWQSIALAGAPIFPYLGLMLLILCGLLLLGLLLYLCYRLARRVPPMSRYFAWRVTRAARHLTRRQSGPEAQQLTAGCLDAPHERPFEESFTVNRRQFWQPITGRPEWPLWVVLGASGSGKSSLLRLTGADTASALETEPDGRWWRWSEHFALELHPRLFDVVEHKKFTRLLSLLRRMRPERPLDGVLVTISTQQLFDPDGAAALTRLAQIVAELCAASESHVPLYLVVTGADQLSGFPELLQLQAADADGLDLHQLGHLHLNQTALDPFFAAWRGKVRSTMLRTLASAALAPVLGQANAVLTLPAQVALLQAPLAHWLHELNESTLQLQAAPIFRGVFLTGLGAPVEGAPAIPFAAVSQAVRAMWFGEADWAQATVRQVARLRRRLLLAAGGLTLSVLVIALWVPNTVARLSRDSAALRAVIAYNKEDIQLAATGQADGALIEPDLSRVPRLLMALNVADDAALSAVLAPSSWFNRTRQRFLSLLGASIQRLLIAPRVAILAQALPLSDAETPPSAAALRANQLSEVPAYQVLLAFLNARELTGKAVETAQTMPKGISYQALTRFLGGDPNQYPSVLWDWEQEVPSAAARHFFNAGLVQPDQHASVIVKERIEAQWERVLQEALDQHPVLVLSEAIGAVADKLMRNEELTYNEAAALHHDLRQLQREVAQPGAQRLLGKAADALQFFSPALVRLSQSSVLSGSMVNAASNAANARRMALRTRLLGLEQDGIGPLFVRDASEDRLVLSPELKRFAASYAMYMTQPFMAKGLSGELDTASLAAGATWNLTQLEPVKTLATGLREFTASGATVFEPGMRPAIVRLAQTNFQRVVETLFVQAATPLAPGSGADMRTQGANLTAAIRLYRLAFPLNDTQNPVGALLSTAIMGQLGDLELQLTAADPYAPILLEMQRWISATEQSRTAAATLRGTAKEQLMRARDYVRSQYVAPAAILLDGLQSMSNQAPADGVALRWRRLIDTINAFDKGALDNSVYELEQYVLSMTKWANVDHCMAANAEREPLPRRSDYFSARLAGFDETLTAACVAHSAALQRRSYASFATWFRQQVAGHYPFSKEHTAPMSQASFTAALERYRDLRKLVPTAPKAWPRPVLAFLAQMDGLVARFSPRERPPAAAGTAADAADVADGSLRAQLQFGSNGQEAVLADQVIEGSIEAGPRHYDLRSNKKVFEWRFGDPLEVRFRIAAQSPYIPVARSDGKELYSVTERTVHFKLAGNWSWFDLLRQHRVADDGDGHLTLAFDVSLVGPQGRRTGKFYLRFNRLDGQLLAAPEFPLSAPPLAAR